MRADETIGALVAGAVRWWAVFLFLFFFTFPFWSDGALWLLRTVLEGLNHFGS